MLCMENTNNTMTLWSKSISTIMNIKETQSLAEAENFGVHNFSITYTSVRHFTNNILHAADVCKRPNFRVVFIV